MDWVVIYVLCKVYVLMDNVWLVFIILMDLCLFLIGIIGCVIKR